VSEALPGTPSEAALLETKYSFLYSDLHSNKLLICRILQEFQLVENA